MNQPESHYDDLSFSTSLHRLASGTEGHQNVQNQAAEPAQQLQHSPGNELIVIEWCIDVTTLTPEQEAVFNAFMQMPIQELVDMLRVLCHWEQAPTVRKAMALKLLNNQLTDKKVAELCGLDPRRLRRYDAYTAFSRSLRNQIGELPGGQKDREGHLDAWVNDD